MTRLFDRWVAFVERREPVVGLALFRIGIGAALAWTLLRIVASGAGRALYLPPESGGMLALTGDWRFALLGGPSAPAVTALTVAALVGAALVAVGWYARPAALVAGQATIALLSLVPESGGGHDRLITNALWLLVLAPCDHSLSLRCRLRTGAWVDPTPRAAVVRYLVMLQLVVTYTITGWQKLGPEWWPWGGLEAVYRSLLQPDWSRHALPWLGEVFPITQLMTAGTIAWEGGFPLVPLWMWGRHRWPALRRLDVRVLLLLAGFTTHAVLESTLNLGPFGFVTVAFYPCFFDADEYASFTRRFRRSRDRTPGGHTP